MKTVIDGSQMNAHAPVIPSFFLYGEPPRQIVDRFLHLEALDDRSRPSHWNIRAHSHANLNHIFFIAGGGGKMRTEGRVTAFSAPCLLLIPSGVVHGFSYEPETHGAVLTLSEAYLGELIHREPGFSVLFSSASAVSVPDDLAPRFSDILTRLSRELAWTAPGHGAAVEAELLALFVGALRLVHQARPEAWRAAGPRAGLVARFRERIEARFRSGAPIQAYLGDLGVTASRLRSACVEVAGKPPIQMIQERTLLEAKRILLYSNMTVTEAAYDLGFDDPAYFSRFFRLHAQESPRAFRRRHLQPGGDA